MRLWFCDPHSRGQRQHLWEPNGLLRLYLPKDTELATYTHDEPDAIIVTSTSIITMNITTADRLDNRPRATPNWQMAGRWLARVCADLGKLTSTLDLIENQTKSESGSSGEPPSSKAGGTASRDSRDGLPPFQFQPGIPLPELLSSPAAEAACPESVRRWQCMKA